MDEILESGRPPAIGGANVNTRALDATAEMVMQDYGMTDLKTPTEIRQGDSQAPKLAPVLQNMADNMFAPKRALEAVGMGRQAGLIARSAMGGAFSPQATGGPDPITAAQRSQNLLARTKILNEKDK